MLLRSATKALLITFYLLAMDKPIYGRKIYAYYDALDCSSYDANYIETVKCWLLPDRRGQLTLNAVLKLKQDLSNIICKFHFIIDLNNRNQTFLSMDLDICSALGTAFKTPILRLVSEEIRRMSNFPYECPLKKDVEYVIENFTIDSKLIPAFAPPLKWIAHSEFYTNSTKQKILRFISSGRVDHIKPKTFLTPKF